MRFRAVLTGASGGIGRAMAAALGPHCDSLVLVGRDKARLSPIDGKSFPLAADITTAQGRDAVASAAPGINLLINNAGVSEFVAFAAQSDASMERMFAVNVLAAMQLTRRLLPALLAQPAAMVVNVGSIMGYLGYPGHAAYSASKFALVGLSDGLRAELIALREIGAFVRRHTSGVPTIAVMRPSRNANAMLVWVGSSR